MYGRIMQVCSMMNKDRCMCAFFFLLCSCAIDAHDCPSICSWFASLSELCRKERHPIKSWRNEEFCRKLTTH